MRRLLAVVNFPHSLSASGFGEREYTYKTYYENLTKGAVVVVETQTGYSVARFVRYIESTDVPNLKYIVQHVNIASHRAKRKACEEWDDYENLLD
ncbi:MAG: hypothetical protein ABS917_11145 [Solibacillus sp.]|uniref:hypothetical protein n=1 Tax=Solibacillus sp. TaxID=1909654 RepID=UPI00331474CD